MIKKTFKYEDFDGIQQRDVLHFHLTERELTLLQNSYPGGLHKHLQRITSKDNIVPVYEFIIEIIEKAYGVKSEDGKKHYKSAELLKEFRASQPYDMIIDEFTTSPDAFTEFLNGVIPMSLKTKIKNLKGSKEFDAALAEDPSLKQLMDSNPNSLDALTMD